MSLRWAEFHSVVKPLALDFMSSILESQILIHFVDDLERIDVRGYNK
jgi:hypothetical protein